MNNAFKRFASFMLALLMVISALPLNTLAAQTFTATVLNGKISITGDGNTTVAGGKEENGTVTATATATAEGCAVTGYTYTANTHTITIKNETADETIMLDFNYAATGLGNLKIDDTDKTSIPTGNYSKSLDPGDTITIEITSPASGTGDTGATTSVTMSNFTQKDTSAKSVTVMKMDGGTTTVNGTALTAASTTVETDYATGVTVKAAPASGHVFLGWVDAEGTVLSTRKEYKVQPLTNMTVGAAFVPNDTLGYWLGGSKLHTDLNAACAAAQADPENKQVVLLKNATLPQGNYEIPSDVTLLIPKDEALTTYGANPALAANGEKWVAPTAYVTLTLGNGANLVVNGTMELAAMHYIATGSGANNANLYGGAINGSYGHVAMKSGSKLTVNGKLYAWGIVSGSGEVIANNGAEVYEKMQITDYRGGGATSAIVSQTRKKAFPFNQYYVQNIEVKETIHYGATVYIHAGVYASGPEASSVAFVGTGTSAMFGLEPGSYIIKDYDESSDRLVVDLHGSGSLNPIGLTFSGQTVNSSSFRLGINNNIDIGIHGGVVKITQNIVLQPGATVSVDKDATLFIPDGVEVFVLDQEDWGNFARSSLIIPVYWSYTNGRQYVRSASTVNDLADAQVDINGTVVVQGKVYTSGGQSVTSTGETGVYALLTSAPTNTTVYQVTGTDTASIYGSSAWTEITVTSSDLVNGDTSVTSTASGAPYDAFIYDSFQDKWIQQNIYNGGAGYTAKLIYNADDGTETPATYEEQLVDYFANASAFMGSNFTTMNPFYTKVLGNDVTNFSREGYSFKGWSTEPAPVAAATAEATNEAEPAEVAEPVAAAERPMVEIGKLVTISADTHLYAVWEGKPFQVYVDGTLDGEQLVGTELTDYLKDLENSKTDFVLKSWKFYKDADSTEEVTLTDNKMPAHDLYIVGEWEAAKVSSAVTVDGTEISEGYEEGAELNTLLGGLFNGKTVADFNFYKADGTNVTEVIRADGKMPAYALYAKTLYTATVVNPDGGDALAVWKEEAGADLTGKTLPTVTPAEGKKFVGWYVDGDVAKAIPTAMPAENFEIMAVFEDLPVYTVTFKVEGATDVEYDADYENNWTITINENDPTKAYHKFTGWLGSDGKTYQKGAEITLTGNLTLTAQFQANEYTIKFYEATGPNMDPLGTITAAYGSDISEKVAAIQQIYEERYSFTTFTGWSTMDGKPVTLTTMPGENMDVLAEFSYNTYTITWVVDGQTIATKDVTYRQTISKVAPADPTKTGYTFLYWQDANGKKVNTSAAYEITGDSTYTAVFAINTYTITWKINGQSVGTTVEHGTVPAFTGNTDKAADDTNHYTFLGWNTVEPAYIAIDIPAATEDVIYYAVYTTTAHNFQETGRTDATCTEEGSVSYKCSGCEKTKTETLEIDKTAHSWNAAITKWADDGSSVTAERTCANDSKHIETATLKGVITATVAKAPTCEETGNTTYTAEFNESWAGTNGTSSKTVIGNIPATGHSYKISGDPVWADDHTSCTVTGDCDNCDATTTATTNSVAVSSTEGNCQTKVVYTYTATFAEPWAGTVTATAEGDVNKTIHTSDAFTYTNNDDGATHTKKHACCGTVANAEETHVFVNGSCVCTAVQTFTVTWIADGEPVATTTVNYGGSVAAEDVPAVPEVTGMTGAWDKEAVYVTDDLIINAVYTAKTYTITLDAGEHGYFGQNEQTRTYSQAYGSDLMLESPTAKEGYYLTGWTVDGNSAQLPTTMPAVARTYVAQWELIDVTVQFSEGETKKLSGNYFGKVTAPTLEKEGYTFLGWDDNTNPEDTEVLYAGGAEITLNNSVKDKLLYAKWQAKAYNITWILNGGSCAEELSATEKCGDQVNLPRSEYMTKPGATFKEWTVRDGVEIQPNGREPGSYCFIMPAHDVTVTANWVDIPYTVSCMDAGDKVVKNWTAFYGNEISETDMPVLTKDSTAQYEYTFSHWTVNGQKVTFPVTVTGDMEFVPVFTETLRKYDITFLVDGKVYKTVSVPYDQTPSVENPTKEADQQYTYTFSHWMDAEGNQVVLSEQKVTGPATYTAFFTEEKVVYTVTFKVDGEIWKQYTGNYNDPLNYSDLEIPAEQTGYSFAWDVDQAEWPKTFTENVEITGTYTPKEYTITFKNDFNTDKDDAFADYTITKKYGEAITESDIAALEARLPTIIGWEFQAWFTVIEEEIEGQKVLKHGDEYKIPETMGAENVTVYAFWDAIGYEMTVKSSIDNEKIGSSTMRYEEHYEDLEEFNHVNNFCYDPACTDETHEGMLMLPEGYTFEGYKYEDGSDMTFPIACWPAEEVTIVAQFKPIDYTIIFMDGESEYAKITAAYGSQITLPEEPTKEGYDFAGWVDADGNAADLSTMPLNGMTVYADWTEGMASFRFFASEGDKSAFATLKVKTGTDLLSATPDDPTTGDVNESAPSVLDGLLAQVDNPTKEGHTWTGWDTDEVPATMPAEGVSVYGTWDVNSYTITVYGYVDGEEKWAVHHETFDYKEELPDLLTTITKAGFKNIKLTDRNNQDVTIPTHMPAENLEYRMWMEAIPFTITFDTNGGEPAVIDPIKAVYDETITWPEAPTKAGHQFLGWDMNGDNKADYMPVTMPPMNLNLKAVWQRNKFYITWNIEGKETSEEYEYGATITAPEATKAADAKWTYKFIGWDPALPETATEAETYTAVFAEDEAVKYTVKFLDGETTVYETQIAWNGEVTLDGFNAPTQTGNDLTWTVEGAEVSFPYAMTTKEVTFLAKWTPKTYTITIDGEEVGTYAYGAAISIPDPTQVGYTFLGWKKDGVEGYCTLPETMPAENIVITSDWKVNTHTLKFEYWAGESDWQTVEHKDVAYGTDLADLIPTVPSWTDSEGLLHEFQAWSDGTAFGVPEKMPDKDLSVYATFTFTGWDTDDEGNTTYYVKSEKKYYNEMVTIEGADYYFDGASYIQKDITLIDGSYYAFDHDSGKFLGDLTGIYTASNGDLYYVENGIAVKNYGLHKVVDENGHIHYYIFGCGLANCQEEGGCQGEYKAQKNNFHMVSKTNGYPLPAGAYDTGDDCVLLHEDDTSLNGICAVEGGLRYMIDGVPVHKGLFEQNGSIYYAKTRGWLVVGQKYWISTNKLNGLTIDGEPITAGVYEFDGEGKMIFVTEKNGFYYNTTEGAWYYYVDNKTSYEGLRYFDGTDGVNGTNGGVLGCTEGHPGYYYINTYGKVIAGRDYWITKTNNTGIKNQTYTFDENGVMQNPVQIRNGIYAEGGKLYYYQDSKLVHAGMLVYSGDLHNEDGTVTADVYNEDYIYVNTKGELKADCSYWTSKTNGLIPAMSYTFDEYGRMVNRPEDGDEGNVKDGIVPENGSLYYYENGVRTYAGVICIDGKYYYVRTSGELAHSRDYWPTKHNGLVKLQTYTFDENGVMQNPVVLGE